MPKKQLVPLLAAVLILTMLAAGVSALVIDKNEIDGAKGTISLMTGPNTPTLADDDDDGDDREIEVPESEDDDRPVVGLTNPTGQPTVDTASSASIKSTGESVSLYAGSGNGVTTPTGQPTVDAASSASIKSTGESVSLYAGSGSGITSPTSQPIVDAASSASIKSPAATSPSTVSPPATVTTQPVVDVVASASLPKPGTTAPTASNPTASTTLDVRLITEADARKIAVAAVGSTALVKEVEFERDDYPPVYEVKLLYGGKEFKIEIHAVTGAIIDVERDEDD